MKKRWIPALAMVAVLVSGLMIAGCPEQAQPEVPEVEPPEVLRWEPSSWLPAGVTWDTIAFIADYVERMSDGRLVMTPSAPGAIVPVSEQLSAVAMGVTEAMFIWPGYFPGEIPIGFMHGDCFAAPRTIAELRYLYEYFEGGRIMEILREEYAKRGVHLVGNLYWTLDNLMISRVPIRGVADLEGVMFRTSELIALQLAHLGAGTMWVPGGEIYTLLATGAVDAITFSHAADMVAMGFHEVTNYWIRKPTVVGPAADALIVNMDVWQALPDDLKAIVEAAVEAGTARNVFTAEMVIAEAWNFVEEHGIEIIEWSEEDARELAGTARVVVPQKYFDDPAFAEIFEIVERWAVEMGYW